MKGRIENEANDDLDVIWGARAIGQRINCNERVAFSLLETKQIPGAKKVGGRWCVSARRLTEFFERESA